ncbi:MAG: phosphotransferase family protein [Pseudomonadales bacterium]
MADALKGIEYDKICDWLAANAAGTSGPYYFDLIAAGGSNLTYRVTDGNGQAFVLRRPPVSGQIATAHDMAREYRIMQALGGTNSGVPVPEMFAYCADTDVTGAEFYCMQWVDGLILRDSNAAATMTRAECRAATESLVDVQIAIQTLDLEAVGLSDLGKHSGYIERQLRRWKMQMEASKTRELPILDELYEQFSANIPAEKNRSGLAHGDYRFDNTVLGADYRIIAVLDWELCTIGDPVADFYWSLMYWADPDDEVSFLPDPPTRGGKFMRRAEVAELYANRSGFDLSDRDFYIAFSWWKSACIVEGVYARMQQGATGGMKTGPLEQVANTVETYLEQSLAAAQRL